MVDVLPLLRDDLVNHLCPDLSLQEVRGSHVSNPEHHHHLTIPLRDHSISGKSQLTTVQAIMIRFSFLLGEHHGVSSFLRSGQLGEDNAGHAGLNDDTDDTLDALHDDRLGTLLGRLPGAVPDGVLGLHAEQEGGGEVLVGQDAGDECSIVYIEEIVLLVVSVLKSNQPPEEAEDEPGDHEAGKEGKESVAPLQVQDGREHVLSEQYYSLTQTDCLHSH